MSNNGYAVDGIVQTAMRKMAGGELPGDPNAKVIARPWTYWHVRAYPTGGTTTLRFFNEARTSNITNLPTQSQIESNSGFLMTGVQMGVFSGLDIDGAGVDAGSQLSEDDLDPVGIAEAIRRILTAPSEVTLKVGERVIFQEAGLYRFPQGGGPEILSSISTVSAASAASGAVVNNGAPIAWNQYQIRPNPWPIMPGQAIDLTVEFAAVVPLGVAGLIRADLNGVLFTRANA